jgi:moderate conductance mechanosensitive channel
MTRSLSVLAADDGSSAMPDCADYWLCQKLYDWFGMDWLAENARVLVATPARILLVVVVAVIARALAHRAILRLTDRTATGAMPTILRPLRNRVAPHDPDGQIIERRTQRAEAIGSVLRSFASIVIMGIAVVLVLGELGINLAPIVASAGVVGVALGFGAQNLIKDFIAGIGIILED